MILANHHGNRITAAPGLRAICPTCEHPVIPKTGTINAWHWAHVARTDCDPWSEPDSTWHRAWQQSVPLDRREVTIGAHRADMVTDDGIVVEVQHSNLNPAEIAEREHHYRRMVWIFDATEAATPVPDYYGFPEAQLDIRTPGTNPDPTYRTFRWKHARKSLAHCTKPVWLDIGNDQVLLLGRIHVGPPCGGWGHLRDRQFLVDLINGTAQ